MNIFSRIRTADTRLKAVLVVVGLGLVAFLATVVINDAAFKPSSNGQTAVIELNQNHSIPSVLVVKLGTTVKWVNTANVDRRITSTPFPQHNDLPGLDSHQNVGSGGSYSYTFTKKGTFGFIDYLHPAVSGKVIVE
jgi:plastocyanin